MLSTDYVVPSFTHLITSKPSTNEKFLGACASGKWVLHQSFLEASKEANMFVKVRVIVCTHTLTHTHTHTHTLTHTHTTHTPHTHHSHSHSHTHITHTHTHTTHTPHTTHTHTHYHHNTFIEFHIHGTMRGWCSRMQMSKYIRLFCTNNWAITTMNNRKKRNFL